MLLGMVASAIPKSIYDTIKHYGKKMLAIRILSPLEVNGKGKKSSL
jgi:hypothetical protein